MPPSVEERARTYAGLKGFHVLIADDMDAIRTLYRTGLSHAVPEMRVSMASDGLETVRLAQELVPDVILMDVTMPGIDGLEATRRIKADPRTRRVRVIAITGTVYDSGTVLAAGCDGYLLKPVTPDEILREIARTFGA